MDNLKEEIKNIKNILIELITYLESNSIDATSLKKTYYMFEVIKDEKQLKELVL